MNARRVLAIVVIVAIGAIVVTVIAKNRQTAANAAIPAPKPAEPTDLSIPAVLQAASSTSVAVPVQGKLESFEVEVGSEVFEGQLLARIGSGALESAKEVAELDLERAETRIKNLESLLSAARLEASRAAADASRVRSDLDRASKFYERQKMMYAEGATPRNTYEKAQKEFAALEVDSKNLDAVSATADERISTLSRELDVARKLLEAKVEDLEGAKERIGAGDVLSPVNGIVVGRRGQAGDDVHPSTTDLFQIATELSTMQAVADVAPAFASKITPGTLAVVLLAELGSEALQGSVSKIEDGKIIVEFANPNPAIKPGLTAQIRIKLP